MQITAKNSKSMFTGLWSLIFYLIFSEWLARHLFAWSQVDLPWELYISIMQIMYTYITIHSLKLHKDVIVMKD